MNFLHSQYIARITGGRNKMEKKERKLWYDFQSRNVSFENETRTSYENKNNFDLRFHLRIFSLRSTQPRIRREPRLDSTRLASGGEGKKAPKERASFANGSKWRVQRVREPNDSRTERWFLRVTDEVAYRCHLSFFLFFFFFILPAEIQTLEYVTNIYIYMLVRNSYVRG